jgi:hypothetical protein
MINTSNEYKECIQEAREFIYGVEITLADDTVLSVDDAHMRSMKINDITSQNGSFTFGALINELTITINNFDDEFSNYDFEGAILRPTIGLQLSATIETFQKGVFIADEYKIMDSVLTIVALDKMAMFDTPFSSVVQVFPCTAVTLLNTVCINCGATLATSTFRNDDYIIQNRPDDEAITCREIVAWVAQIAGCFARFNKQGALELKRYDFEIFEQTNLDGGYFDNETPYQSGDSVDGGNLLDYSSGDNIDGGTFADANRYHHIYALGSSTFAMDNVVITGVQVTDTAETQSTVLFGSEGYVISIENNKLIQSQTDAQMVSNSVGASIVGMRFRPCSLSAVSDPSREAGDVAYVTDRRQNTYQVLLTNVTYETGKHDKISCDAETPLRKNSTRYAASTKTIVEARKITEQKLTAYDLMVQQLNNLISHSFGFYSSEEVLPDGSKIYYKHDKPTRAESMKIWKETIDAFAVSTDGGVTYTAGFDVNGNAVFNVIAAIGIELDWVRAGKLLSNDGSTLIDMAYGVANSDNFSFIDNIQNGFPLTMPFNIDDSVSKINRVLLKFTQQNFRTYSTAASSGGNSSTTSSGGGGTTTSSGLGGYLNSISSPVTISGNTDGAVASETLPHSHTVGLGSHTHSITLDSHVHDVSIPAHTHGVNIPSHTHELNFGIQEQAISNNEITIYVDGTLRATTSELQGIIDLTAFISTPGWHAIEIRSTTLKRISAQINIKSYIRS